MKRTKEMMRYEIMRIVDSRGPEYVLRAIRELENSIHAKQWQTPPHEYATATDSQ